jgi:hypothetical protein
MSIWNWWAMAWLAVGDAILVVMFLAWDAKRFDMFARKCAGALPPHPRSGSNEKRPAEAGQGRLPFGREDGEVTGSRRVPM